MTDTSSTPFDVLLRDSLNIASGDELLVIYDESLEPFWDQFLAAVLRKGCPATFIHLPIPFQQALSRKASDSEIALPIGLRTAIDEVDVIITMVCGDINLAGVRRAVVSKAIGISRPGNRLAHIPGISAEILDVLTRSPIAAIEKECEALAWALGEARECTLTTCGSDRRQHVLTCALGGWANEPLMSPGVIYNDSWGNVPPGETFCCPAAAGVSGSVVINGSIPGYVCGPNEDVVLEFDHGKLIAWNTRCEPLAAFFENQRRIANERQDDHWNTFAELGIGLNPAIVSLTGNSLFDEKAHGTVHIAIGDNYGFGHGIKSHIHADLVIRQPSLQLDNQIVIDAGNLRIDAIVRWRNELRPEPLDPSTLVTMQIRPETFESHPRHQDVFARRLHSRGRTGYVTVARDDDAEILRGLYCNLSVDDWQSPDQVMSTAGRRGVSSATLARLLGLLFHYHMLDIASDRPTGGRYAHS